MRYLFLLLILLLTACGTEPKKAAILNTLPSPYPTAELLIAPPDRATPTPWLSPLSATTMAYYGPKMTEIAVNPPLTAPLKIDGETYGLYGKDVTLNAGTDAEMTSIGYFVPSGNYRAINNRTFRDQVNVYSPDTVWTDGFEYAADGNAYLVEAGDYYDFYVPVGWYIKIVPPADITLSPINYTYPAVTPESKDPSAIHMPKNIYSPTPKPTDKPCYVKGNPDSMIYHCPGSPNYNDLTGYKCFSSSAEAEAAGYRPAMNMSWCPY